MVFPNAALLTLVFTLGAASGALLNAMYRAAQIEKIKADFVRQLEETVANSHQAKAQTSAPATSEPSAGYPRSA
jgi:hypothetical protein